MKKILATLAMLGAGLFSSSIARATIVPLYRFNHEGTDHLYTTNYGEGVSAGYAYEGIQCYVDDSPDAGTVPLYRYFMPGHSHFYTTNWSELGGGTAGYNYEGIQCYVWSSPQQGTEPFYRYRLISDAGIHFYTTNPKAEVLGGISFQQVTNPLYDPEFDPDGIGIDEFGNPEFIIVVVQSSFYAPEGIQCYVLTHSGGGDPVAALAGDGDFTPDNAIDANDPSADSPPPPPPDGGGGGGE